MQLPAAVSTKTAKVGDRLSANLTNDLVVDGKTVARAGALVQGSVTQVISGSNTIGGTPTLGITFDNLTFEGGDKPINARITQVSEKSDKAGDTAKIAGGAVAGGVIGHQISQQERQRHRRAHRRSGRHRGGEEDRQGSRASRRDRSRHDPRVAGYRHDVTQEGDVPRFRGVPIRKGTRPLHFSEFSSATACRVGRLSSWTQFASDCVIVPVPQEIG